MSDQVDFPIAVGGPQIYRENKERSVHLAISLKSALTRAKQYLFVYVEHEMHRERPQMCRSKIYSRQTYLMSTSLPVALSLTMSLTHGGGVMGRRSCRLPLVLIKNQQS